MRFSASVVLFAGFASFAAAVSMSSLPDCAKSCVTASLEDTGCDSLSVKCICKDSSWISGITCCVASACDSDEQADVLTFAHEICDTVGVTTLPTVVACSTATATATSASTASTSKQTGNTTVTVASKTATKSSTATAASASSSSTGSAAKILLPGVGAGAVVLAAFALF